MLYQERNLAGSAIAKGHNVGVISPGSRWKPTSLKPRWLLLAGASDPPKGVKISKRRPRDNPGVRGGAFLAGVTHDLANMEAAVGSKLYNTVKDLYLTKSRALKHISNLFDICTNEMVKPMLYYTGHGEIGTGNWCFDDGTISIQDILDILPEGVYYPMIFSDACYSGHWANFCLQKNIAGFHCLAACPEYSTALDTNGEGGDLTLFMTGKKRRPRTEPMYSRRNKKDFPITSGYDAVKYKDFVASHITNSKNILVCQNMCDGYFSGCFAPLKSFCPRPPVHYAIRKDYSAFRKLVRKIWGTIDKNKKFIYSLACDESLGFGAFFIENYGTDQCIVTNLRDIDKKFRQGFKITACTAKGSSFFVVMTSETEEFKDKRQTWFTCNTWTKVEENVQMRKEKGEIISGMCYSTGLSEYFVVMTETGEEQSYYWLDKETQSKDLILIDDESKFENIPTVIFRDPNQSKTLVVITADAKKSGLGYHGRFDFKLKT